MNLEQIQVDDLQDAARFNEVQAAVLAAEDDGANTEMVEFRHRLNEFFEVYEDLERKDKDYFKRLRNLRLYIELHNFNSMPERVQKSILKKHTGAFKKAGASFTQSVAEVMILADAFLVDEKAATLMGALLANTELLSKKLITVDGRQVKPTVGNWLKKYRDASGNKYQDGLQQIDFVSRGDARTLGAEERERLQEVIAVFNDLLPNEEEEILEQAEAEEQAAALETSQTPDNTPRYSPFGISQKKAIVPDADIAAFTKKQDSAAGNSVGDGVKPKASASQPVKPSQAAQSPDLTPLGQSKRADGLASSDVAGRSSGKEASGNTPGNVPFAAPVAQQTSVSKSVAQDSVIAPAAKQPFVAASGTMEPASAKKKELSGRNTNKDTPGYTQDQRTPKPQSAPRPTTGQKTFSSLADLEHIDLAMVHGTGATPEQFAKRIKSEVAKVYQRSPESKQHIVDIWRKSPLYMLYMEMGKESMEKKKSIVDIAAERAKKKKSVLTKEEFDVIADLSKSIQ